MIEPVYYLQGDNKWRWHDYSAPGEQKTIGAAGCGITASAMILQTLRPDLKITPVETAEWSKKHGYKYLNQGTAYAYFAPQFKEYGITCAQINYDLLYHKPTHKVHEQVKALVSDPGYFVIAVMGPGNWTTAGHYVVLWKIDEDGMAYINDPASKGIGKSGLQRTKAPFSVFKNEVKYYWSVKYGAKYKTKKVGKLYSKKDVSSKGIGKFAIGDDIWVVKDCKDGWSIVTNGVKVGYAKNSIIKGVGLSTYPTKKLCKNSNLYESNNKLSKKLAKLTPDTKVRIVSRHKYWTNVKADYNTQLSGWVRTSHIDW